MKKFNLILENMTADQVVDHIYKSYFDIVTKQIAKFKDLKKSPVDPALVLAIIHQESKGHPFASRYEPAFYKWLSAKIVGKDLAPFVKLQSRDTEMQLRSTSFGVGQIMGQTARECGFTGTFLTELCDPEVNIYFMLVYLDKLAKRYTELNDIIAAYNAGSAKRNNYNNYTNQSYVNEVTDKLFLVRKRFFNKETELV